MRISGKAAISPAGVGKAVAEGFMKIEHSEMLLLDSDPVVRIDALEQWQASTVTKWIDPCPVPRYSAVI